MPANLSIIVVDCSLRASIAAFTGVAFNYISVGSCGMTASNATCMRATVFGIGAMQTAPLQLLDELSHSPYPFLDGNAYFQRFTNITFTNITLIALEAPDHDNCATFGTCVPFNASPPVIDDQNFTSTMEQVR